MIFDQLIFNTENIMLLLILLLFIFTKVSRYLSLQYDMLQNISSWIITILQSIAYRCIMIRHYITRSLSLNQISCIASLQSLVSKFWFQRKNDFLFRKINCFYNNFKFYFISFCKLSPFLQQKKLCLSVADPMLWRSTFYKHQKFLCEYKKVIFQSSRNFTFR